MYLKKGVKSVWVFYVSLLKFVWTIKAACKNVITSVKRAAKRLTKRALLTNVYVYRKVEQITEAKPHIRSHRNPSSRQSATGNTMEQAHGQLHGGSCDLKLAKMYVIEKCCNRYRPRSCKHRAKNF